MAILDLYKPPFTRKKYFIAIVVSAVLLVASPFVFGYIIYFLSLNKTIGNLGPMAQLSSLIGIILGGGHFLLYLSSEFYHKFKKK